MLSQKSRQKLSSFSSVDSGLGHSIKKKTTNRSAMSKETNYSQQLLQVANLTAKTQLLKKGLMNSNEKVQGFMNKISPVKKSENESDFENITTSSQFSPSSCSIQLVKKSESTSESSDEGEFSSEKTVRVKNNCSTDSDAGSYTLNVLNRTKEQISKSNINSKNKSKVHILDNQLILSDSKEEGDSDSKSITAICKSNSTYSVSSEFDSEGEKVEVQAKSKRRNVHTLNTNKSRLTLTDLKNSRTGEQNDSDSSEFEKGHPRSDNLSLKLKNSSNRINKKGSEHDSELSDSEDENNRKLKDIQKKKHESKGKSRSKSIDVSIVRTSDATRKKEINIQKPEIPASKNISFKASQRDNGISSTESESSEEISLNERDSNKTIQSKTQQKKLNHTTAVLENLLNEKEGYEKVTIPHKADLADIDSDDEVYLLQIPKSINPKVMEGVSFSLDKKSKLKLESGKYFIKRQSECTPSLITYSNSLKMIRPLATLRMEKYLKTKGQSEIVVAERIRQPLPNNIKIRHPLFGSDYESKIQLEEQIKDKLEKALQRFYVKEKSPKRKKRIKEEVEDKNLLISKILEEKFGNVKNSTMRNKNIGLSSITRAQEVGDIQTDFFNQIQEINENAENEEKNISFGGECLTIKDFKTTIKKEIQDSSYMSNNSVNEFPSKRKKKSKQYAGTKELILELSSENPSVIKNERFEPEGETTIKQEIQPEINNKSKRLKSSNKNKISGQVITIDAQLPHEKCDESIHKNKKKKARRNTEMFHENLEMREEIEGNENNQLKNKRYNQTEDEIAKIDSEFTINKNSKHKKSELKKELYKHEECESNTFPIKKKKKHKNLEYIISDDLSVKKEPLDEYSLQSPKKRRKSVLSSTAIFDNLDIADFKVDVSKIEIEEPVVKKQKNVIRIQDNTNNDLISSLLFSAKNRLDNTSDRKKRKRKSS